MSNHSNTFYEIPDCPNGTVQIGNFVCGSCPAEFDGDLKDAQEMLDRSSPYYENESEYAQQIHAQETNVKNIGKVYCGNSAHIRHATLYTQCYGGRAGHNHQGIRNPYHYKSIGDPGSCFTSGKTVGSLNASNTTAINAAPVIEQARGRGRRRVAGGSASRRSSSRGVVTRSSSRRRSNK